MHMPPPSYWPIFTAFGVMLTFVLFLTPFWWAPLIGLAWTAIGVDQLGVTSRYDGRGRVTELTDGTAGHASIGRQVEVYAYAITYTCTDHA